MFFIYPQNACDIDTCRGSVMCLSHVPEESSLSNRNLLSASGPCLWSINKECQQASFCDSTAYKVGSVH